MRKPSPNTERFPSPARPGRRALRPRSFLAALILILAAALSIGANETDKTQPRADNDDDSGRTQTILNFRDIVPRLGEDNPAEKTLTDRTYSDEGIVQKKLDANGKGVRIKLLNYEFVKGTLYKLFYTVTLRQTQNTAPAEKGTRVVFTGRLAGITRGETDEQSGKLRVLNIGITEGTFKQQTLGGALH